MSTVRDRLWIWGHEAGSHDKGYNIPAPSRMTPAEGAMYLDVPNLIMVRYDGRPAPPYRQYALSLRPLDRFVWSIVGAGGATAQEEIEAARRLAVQFPNMTGVMMDDFFRDDPAHVGVYTPESLARIKTQLSATERPLDLWVVLYQHQLDLPIEMHLSACDVVTFWTWWAERIDQLEAHFERFERVASANRRVLGCYMWDYGHRKPMPVERMERQCELGLQWLKDGRIEGMIFLASCICDLDLDAVEWTRQWIQDVGGQRVA